MWITEKAQSARRSAGRQTVAIRTQHIQEVEWREDGCAVAGRVVHEAALR